ncbi:MAG: PAS domain S-box protein, partial [Desulfobacula sp.]|nr:PAS domain S-box protein [Desulfobacula sp.]
MDKKPISDELKQAESKHNSKKRLFASHDLMDYIISHARSAIAVFDNDLKYIYVSKRYLKDYKVKEQNVIGKSHYEIFPDIPQRWKDAHQRSLSGEVLNAEEDPYHREDGSVDWTRWECRPWYESDGSIGGIIIYNEVINERKKIEEALRQSKQLLSTHLLNTPIGAIAWDLEFRTVEWNPAAEAIFGYTKDEAMGKHIT